MESGLWSLGALALSALGFVAYNHPRSYRLYFRPLIRVVFLILAVAFFFWQPSAPIDPIRFLIGSGVALVVAFYLVMLELLENMGVT
jgi:hypothetical protein